MKHSENIYLQNSCLFSRSQALVRASRTVKGMDVANKRSDSARLKMNIFLAVLISFLRTTADIINMFSSTKNGEKFFNASLPYLFNFLSIVFQSACNI